MSDFRCERIGCSVFLKGIEPQQWHWGTYCSEACQGMAMAIQLIPADAAWDMQLVTSGTVWDTQRLLEDGSSPPVQLDGLQPVERQPTE